MGVIKINFGHYVGKYRHLVMNFPDNFLSRDRRLELGVVLV